MTGPGTIAGSSGNIPQVFISYSHGPDDHNAWVRELAERLQSDGIKTLLDQTDLRLGMSPSSFMEESLQICDRVLLIVTEEYTKKSDRLTGGVGFEKMIITSEIAQNLRTTKFIPILRSGNTLPKFLGDRLFVDARTKESWSVNYSKLVRELKHATAETKSDSRSADDSGDGRRDRRSRSKSSMSDPSGYHWSHHVQSHVGNTLFLIFLRFASSSIRHKGTVITDIRESGITDFSTFHLYASQDLLVRVWADQDSLETLRKRLSENRDLDWRDSAEFMEANSVYHFRDDPLTDPSDAAAEALARTLDAEQIAAIQSGLGVPEFEKELIARGLRVRNNVRFDKDRIQFYIIVRSLRRDLYQMGKLLESISGFKEIKNKTVYGTIGTASEAVIKGQVNREDYYVVYSFLNAVTDTLDNTLDHLVSTETVFVAIEGMHGNGHIDTAKAERHLLERSFRDVIGPINKLRPAEEYELKAKFARAASAMKEDKASLLRGLIGSRARGSADDFDKLRTFFAQVESSLVKNLPVVLVKLFGSEAESVRKQLLDQEGIDQTKGRRLVLGDVLKLYRRLIEDYEIIDLDPLDRTGFRTILQDAPRIRNELAHESSDLSKWDEVFNFFQGFVRITFRLDRYFDSLRQ